MVIPALALPTKLAATAYMATFVVGTMAAMGGYTAVIGALLPDSLPVLCTYYAPCALHVARSPRFSWYPS